MPDVMSVGKAGKTLVFGPYTGNYKIAGVLTVEGTPAQRPVYLYRRTTNALVAKTASAADGSYSFLYLTRGTYAVLGIDKPANEYNAVVADRIEAVPMS